MRKDLAKSLINDLAYSVRRYYVDDFYFRQIACFPPGSRILDVGGRKEHKRGHFDVGNYPLKVEYANIAPETQPDHLCDAAALTCEAGRFDGVICSEVLEHVPNPGKVMAEIFRVLKQGGKALVVAPFMYHIHADPVDYGRYTDYYWRAAAQEAGFEQIELEYQGAIYAVMANLVKVWAAEQAAGEQLGRLRRVALRKFVSLAVTLLMRWDKQAKTALNPAYHGNTTGFGMVLSKGGGNQSNDQKLKSKNCQAFET